MSRVQILLSFAGFSGLLSTISISLILFCHTYLESSVIFVDCVCEFHPLTFLQKSSQLNCILHAWTNTNINIKQKANLKDAKRIPVQQSLETKKYRIIYVFDIRVHPVQISSRSDYCIRTNIIWKTPKMLKNNEVGSRGLVPTILLEPDLSWTCCFR